MVLDEFVIAHTLGWWAKALMLRHSGMCVNDDGVLFVLATGSRRLPPTRRLWVGSILFELSELSLQVRVHARPCSLARAAQLWRRRQ